jgi:hypothetical protein
MSPFPPLMQRTEAGTMANDRRPTMDVASPLASPVPVVYGCSKNAPDPATLCHFFAPSARPAAAASGSASRCSITRSGLVCGRPGDPQAEWHRCTELCHLRGACQRSRRHPPMVLAEPCPRSDSNLYRGAALNEILCHNEVSPRGMETELLRPIEPLSPGGLLKAREVGRFTGIW